MPELPEVETIRRQLEPELLGRRIEAVEVLDERFTRPHPPDSLEDAVGREIVSVGRRGKYLLLGLEGGRTLVLHLRMTGNMRLEPEDPAPPFLRAVFRLDEGDPLLFLDTRRFGHGELIETGEVPARFEGRVGVEPLSDEFSAEGLLAIAAGRRAPLKSFLMTQSGIAGIGNIYADEALHRARLHPLSPAGSMRLEHAEALREAVIETLEAGLTHQGASMSDYRDARGERGSMQDEFLVHGREGEPCPRCGATIRRVVVAGRSTYFCPACQVRLRRRPRRRAPRRRR